MKQGLKVALLACLALGLVAAAPVDAQAQGKKPNILVIWGDDMVFRQ